LHWLSFQLPQVRLLNLFQPAVNLARVKVNPVMTAQAMSRDAVVFELLSTSLTEVLMFLNLEALPASPMIHVIQMTRPAARLANVIVVGVWLWVVVGYHVVS
jgi:hypothetical protein